MNTHTFYKYQGAGNDFIIFDNRNGGFERNNVDLVRRLCDRRFGIGADGLMLLQNVDGYDFEMIYFNADGREGSMCGNGGRCIVAFAQDLGIVGAETDFLAADGVHHAKVHTMVGWISLKMGDVTAIERDGDAYILNTGSPHYVKQVVGLDAYPVVESGRDIRYNDTFRKEGVNVNFVEAEGNGYYVRTYERGVEDETLACGTGATAVALAMARLNGIEGFGETPIRVAGGKLTIRFNRTADRFTEVFLEGPAEFVFKGEITW
ncbi:diaminopimelate epimerase [Parapedobacter indicus]|uniref:Diaminopimelate epimerase n=1 Tax=Parapedobacter indicus TaxID=1477437 RepID=A0A1I3N3H6_9SPHI|nr:diaminopimelate epimerase [Parapedobacter indicus]PPL00862.1 diaminopimelate epimerase [Parapedobacter indicus]SFJ03580.1 diaminopimelate epimerase [Parapedobacter indicus]